MFLTISYSLASYSHLLQPFRQIRRYRRYYEPMDVLASCLALPHSVTGSSSRDGTLAATSHGGEGSYACGVLDGRTCLLPPLPQKRNNSPQLHRLDLGLHQPELPPDTTTVTLQSLY